MATDHEEQFEKAYEEYRELVIKKISIASLFDKGIISEKDMSQRLGGVSIYQHTPMVEMEEILEDMSHGDPDIYDEMKGRYDSIVEASHDVDFIEKIGKQREIEKQRRKNRDEIRRNLKLFLAIQHDDGKKLFDALKDTIHDVTKIGSDLKSIKIADIDLGRIDLA